MKKLKRCLLFVTFGFYCLVLVYLLFLNRGYQFERQQDFSEYIRYAVNLIPFKTLTELFARNAERSINTDIVFDNAVGNFLLFSPMGIYLPSLRKKVRKIGRFGFFIFLTVLTVESLQLLLCVGSFDVDDIMLNMAGAIAGYGIWKTRVIQKLLRTMQWLR